MVYFVTACFILMDLLTGLIKAFKKQEYNSSVMREGLYHKGGSVLCVVLGALVDYAQTLVDLGVTIPLASTICVYIILMEIGSVIENISIINPDIMPNKLKSYFYKLAESEKENDAESK